MSEQMISPEDLAKRWGMSLGTLQNWRSKGKGPAYVKLPYGRRKIAYLLADIEEFEKQVIRSQP